MKNNKYISQLNLEEFQIILNEFQIDLDEDKQKAVLAIIQNNQYALMHEQYLFILENSIKKLTSEFTCQKLISYFKPLTNV